MLFYVTWTDAITQWQKSDWSKKLEMIRYVNDFSICLYGESYFSWILVSSCTSYRVDFVLVLCHSMGSWVLLFLKIAHTHCIVWVRRNSGILGHLYAQSPRPSWQHIYDRPPCRPIYEFDLLVLKVIWYKLLNPAYISFKKSRTSVSDGTSKKSTRDTSFGILYDRNPTKL